MEDLEWEIIEEGDRLSYLLGDLYVAEDAGGAWRVYRQREFVERIKGLWEAMRYCEELVEENE